MKNMIKISTILIVIASLPMLGCSSNSTQIVEELQSYGSEIASSFTVKVNYDALVQTLEKPRQSYVLTFSTEAPELQSLPGADTDKVKYFSNLARTQVWQAKTCNARVKQLMAKHKLFLVSFNLRNKAGETQSMAVCTSR